MTTEITTFDLSPTSLDEAMKYAELISTSNICPKAMQGKPGDVLVAVQLGNEVGLKPLQAIQNIAVINGRPTLWGDAMLALVRSSGAMSTIVESVAEGVATCTVVRSDDPAIHERTFSLDQAKRAGLLGKQGPWSQYPERMLQLRARGFALRDIFGDVLCGLYSREEVEDMPIIKDVAQTTLVIEKDSQPKPASAKQKLKEKMGKGKAEKNASPTPSQSVVDGGDIPDKSDADKFDEAMEKIATAETADHLTAIGAEIGVLDIQDPTLYGKLRGAFQMRMNRLQPKDPEQPPI